MHEINLKCGLKVWRPDVPGIAFTTRLGGVSRSPYDSLNLGRSGDDDPEAVSANRRRVSAALGIPANWRMVRQVHGCRVVDAGPPVPAAPTALVEADAVVVRSVGEVAAVLVADCVPVAVHAPGVAVAIHAGWRGLCAGVIGSAVARAREPLRPGSPPALRAWIGPSIGPCCFEVGPEVPAAFARRFPGAPACTVRVGSGQHFDLRAAAAYALELAGVAVAGGTDLPCTACDPTFFSHRRDARRSGATGRQALLTWIPAGGANQ